VTIRLPKLNQLSSRGVPTGAALVERFGSGLAALTIGRQIGGPGIIELACKHAAPVFSDVDAVGIHDGSNT